jgi:hypothetical protein
MRTICAAALVAALVPAVAAAGTRQHRVLPHQQFAKMSKPQLKRWLSRQTAHDKGAIRWLQRQLAVSLPQPFTEHSHMIPFVVAVRRQAWSLDLRWFRTSLRIASASLREVVRQERAQVARLEASASRPVMRIAYANSYCESGGNPRAVDPSGTYYGKWQFDQGTWDSFAPPGWRGVNPASAPEYVQDEAAMNVTYDAWPNC